MVRFVGQKLIGNSLIVMPGLVPGIHVLLYDCKTWMAGTSPAMTH
jgi:hypothetical protein